MTPRDKKYLHDLHEKHYGSGGKKETTGDSRNSLMLMVKERGIKNYRILNKEELMRCLDKKTSPDEILMIIDIAKKRWKAGWGKRK